MATSSQRQHVGKGNLCLVRIPRSLDYEDTACLRVVPDEPEDHNAIGPVCEHRNSHHGTLPAALRVSGPEVLLGLTEGHFYAPARRISFYDGFRGDGAVRIHEERIGVCPLGITAQHEQKDLLASHVRPNAEELMKLHSDLLSIDVDFGGAPLQLGVPAHGSGGRHAGALAARTSLGPWNRAFREMVNCGVHPSSSRYVNSLGKTSDNGPTRVSNVSDDTKRFSLFQPAFGKLDQLPAQFRLLLVQP